MRSFTCPLEFDAVGVRVDIVSPSVCVAKSEHRLRAMYTSFGFEEDRNNVCVQCTRPLLAGRWIAAKVAPAAGNPYACFIQYVRT